MSAAADQSGPWPPEQLVLMAQRFVALADTLVDDFDVADLLDRLVRDCVDLIKVSAAGIVLVNRDGSLDLVASSDEASRLIELFELERDEGPCIEAVRTGEAAAYPDLASLAATWPAFAAATGELGFTSVYTVPLRLRAERIGALNLFSDRRPPLPAHERHLAQAMADVATIGILQQRSLAQVSQLSEQLQLALNSRITLEQAKGVVAEYAGIDVGAAFGAIRSYARSNGATLGSVAARIVTRELPPRAVVRAGR